MKARITAIHEDDDYYNVRKDLIGKIGTPGPTNTFDLPRGYHAGDFELNRPHKMWGKTIYFYGFQFEEIKPKKARSKKSGTRNRS